MLSKRKRVMAKRTLPPMYIQNPPYQPMYPMNQPPEYLHHGNTVRAPLNHPPVAAHYQPGPYFDWHYQPNRPVYNPHPQYPVNPPIIYDNSHYNYYHPNYPQPLAYSQVSEHGSILPPQNNLVRIFSQTKKNQSIHYFSLYF